MRILFISRAYPPVIGGIEKQNFEICRALSGLAEVTAITNPRGRMFLVPFFLRALYQSYRLRRQYDVVLLGDGVLAPLAGFIKRFRKVPVVCIVHGLDITYRNFIYRRFWVGYFFRFVDRFVAVGNETIRQGIRRGLDSARFVFVPNGVDASIVPVQHGKSELARIAGRAMHGPVVLTLGRLVRRKGVAWFIRHVMPLLDSRVTYLVAGSGPEEECIRQAVADSEYGDRIRLLGQVSESDKLLLLSTADVFVQPNIRVANDMEGFGLVVLEAALCGTPVVASRLEGLQDAITDGRNGYLVEAENAAAFAAKLNELLARPELAQAAGEKARRFVIENQAWHAVAGRYLELLRQLAPQA